jgi:hypothetical protein
MSTAACFERDHATRLRHEEFQQLPTTDPLAENDVPALIRPMRVENILRDIQTDCGNFRHGRLPQVVLNNSTLAHRCRRGVSTPSPPSAVAGHRIVPIAIRPLLDDKPAGPSR